MNSDLWTHIQSLPAGTQKQTLVAEFKRMLQETLRMEYIDEFVLPNIGQWSDLNDQLEYAEDQAKFTYRRLTR